MRRALYLRPDAIRGTNFDWAVKEWLRNHNNEPVDAGDHEMVVYLPYDGGCYYGDQVSPAMAMSITAGIAEGKTVYGIHVEDTDTDLVSERKGDKVRYCEVLSDLRMTWCDQHYTADNTLGILAPEQVAEKEDKDTEHRAAQPPQDRTRLEGGRMSAMPTDDELQQFGWAPGWYIGPCHTCGETHVAAKRASRCRPCAVKAHGEHWDWVARYKAEKAAEEASAKQERLQSYEGKTGAEILATVLDCYVEVDIDAILDEAGYVIVRKDQGQADLPLVDGAMADQGS